MMTSEHPRFFALVRPRQTVLAAAVAFVASFALYCHTLSPAFHPDDSPETITAGATLSHQHPPGYPLHSLLGHLSLSLGPGGPAFSVNLVAAFFGALAVALACLCLFEIFWELAPWECHCPPLSLAAVGLSLVLACTQTLWFQATIAKGGVYTLTLALNFATLYCILKVRAAGLACPIEQLRGEGPFAGRGLSCGCPAPAALRLAGLFFGLGLANHWTSQVVLLPGYAILLAEPRVRRAGWPSILNLLRIAAWPVFFALLGFSLYLYLPLRAQAPLVWGDTQSLRGLWWVFNRSQYSGVEAGKSWAVFEQLMAYVGHDIVTDYSAWGVLALAGGWALLFRRRPFLAGGLLALPATLAVAVAWKANPPADSYFIMDPYLVPVHVGLGLGLAGWGAMIPLRRWLGLAGLAAALALGALQFPVCDHAGDFIGYDYVRNLFLSTPHGALLYCEGDSNTAGPFFERFVQHHRPDVTIVTTVLSDYPWYRQALQRQDPGLKLPPQPLGPPANMAWMGQHNPSRPVVWTNSYTKGWVDESHLLPRGLVWLWSDKGHSPWPVAQLLANRVWPAYSLRGVFQPYQRRQDAITVRLVQENYISTQGSLAQALQASGDPKAAAEEYRHLGRLKQGWAPAWIQAGNADYQAKDVAAEGRDWEPGGGRGSAVRGCAGQSGPLRLCDREL